MAKLKQWFIYSAIGMASVFALLCIVVEPRYALLITGLIFLTFLLGIFVFLPGAFLILQLIQISGAFMLIGIGCLFKYLLPEKFVHYAKNEPVHPITFVPVSAVALGLLYLIFRDVVGIAGGVLTTALLISVLAGPQFLYNRFRDRREKRLKAQYLEKVKPKD